MWEYLSGINWQEGTIVAAMIALLGVIVGRVWKWWWHARRSGDLFRQNNESTVVQIANPTMIQNLYQGFDPMQMADFTVSVTQAVRSLKHTERSPSQDQSADETAAEGLFDRALRLLKEGDPEVAASLMTAAEVLVPAKATVRLASGALQWLIRRPNEAIPKLVAAIQLESLEEQPDSDELAFAHHCLGFAFFDARRYPEAIASASKAVELNPEVADHHFGLAHFLNQVGKEIEAIVEYKKALAKGFAPAPVHAGLGSSYYCLGQQQEALNECKLASRIDPADATNWIILAHVQWKLRERSKAIEACERAIDADPSRSDFCEVMGRFLFVTRDFDAAAESCRRAIRLDRTNAHAWWILACVYAAVRRFPESIAAIGKAIGISPELREEIRALMKFPKIKKNRVFVALMKEDD